MEELIKKITEWALQNPKAAEAIVTGQAYVTKSGEYLCDDEIIYEPPAKPISLEEIACYDSGFESLAGWRNTIVNSEKIIAMSKFGENGRFKLEQNLYPLSDVNTASFAPPSVHWAVQRKIKKSWRDEASGVADNVTLAILAMQKTVSP